MALNYIWIGFFLLAFFTAILKLTGYIFKDFFLQFGYHANPNDLMIFSHIVQSTFDMATTSVTISIGLIGAMALWLGIMKIGEEGGAINILSRIIGPFFQQLFPEVPKNHPAFGSMLMNFSANLLGLDNAATPLGLKAMNELQTLNPKPDTATNAQIMFLVLNASGLTIIPVSIMAIRAANGSANPSEIFIPILITTYCSTLAGLIAVSIYQKINLFKPIVLAYLAGGTLAIAGLIWYFTGLPQEKIGQTSSLIGNGIIFSIIISFILLALKKKINIFETFIEGAKNGFDVAIKIIPYLVAMLVAIGVFRASGAMDILMDLIRGTFLGINQLLLAIGSNRIIDVTFVEALPVAIMKPLSGSGARGLMVDAMKTYGTDSFIGNLSATLQGATETTFYVLAVYYGAVSVKRARHTVACALIADIVGVIAAIIVAYIFFTNN
jgi:spore maturation protein SpmA